MIYFKDTVDFRGMQPQALLIIHITEQVYASLGFPDCWITSVCDMVPQRVANSLHAKGLAVDFRFPILHSGGVIITYETLAAKLRAKFGPQFDVVLEKDHIHVEFDPKNK